MLWSNAMVCIEEPIARDSQSIITRKVDTSGKYAKTSYETV